MEPQGLEGILVRFENFSFSFLYIPWASVFISMYFHRKYDTVSFVTSQKQKDRVVELRLLHLPTWWHGFDLESICMRIVLDSITVEQGVLQTLSVSFHQYTILIFVYMLILKERQSSEVWGPTAFFRLQRASAGFMFQI